MVAGFEAGDREQDRTALLIAMPHRVDLTTCKIFCGSRQVTGLSPNHGAMEVDPTGRDAKYLQSSTVYPIYSASFVDPGLCVSFLSS